MMQSAPDQTHEVKKQKIFPVKKLAETQNCTCRNSVCQYLFKRKDEGSNIYRIPTDKEKHTQDLRGSTAP